MLSAILTGCEAAGCLEGLDEVGLVVEAGFGCDVRQRPVGFREKLARGV